MAKYERKLIGDFDDIIKKIEDGILAESVSASLEDESHFRGKVWAYRSDINN